MPLTPPPRASHAPLTLIAALTLLGAHLSVRAARCGEGVSALAASKRVEVRVEGSEEVSGEEARLTLNQWAARGGYTFKVGACPITWGEPAVWLTREGAPPRRASRPLSLNPHPQPPLSQERLP